MVCLCVDFINRALRKSKLRVEKVRLALLTGVRGGNDRIRPFPSMATGFVVQATQLDPKDDFDFDLDDSQFFRSAHGPRSYADQHVKSKKENLFTKLHPTINIPVR